MSSFICTACSTPNADRASCEACGTAGPHATAAALAATALADAAAARACQLEEQARGNKDLAHTLARVVDHHLDEALQMQQFTEADQ